jgi:hypothetical protein
LRCSWSSFDFSNLLVWLHVFFFCLCSFQLLVWNLKESFCSCNGTVPYRSSAQMLCREESVVSVVALSILVVQTELHRFRSAVIARHLANSVKRSLLRSYFFRVRHQFVCGHPRGRDCRPSKSRHFFGLGLMTTKRCGLSIEEGNLNRWDRPFGCSATPAINLRSTYTS